MDFRRHVPQTFQMSCAALHPAPTVLAATVASAPSNTNSPPRALTTFTLVTVAVCLAGIAFIGETPARIAAACGAVGALWGLWHGAFRHITRWVWMFVAFFAAWAGVAQFGAGFAAWTGLSPWIATLGLGTCIWAGVGLLGRFVTRRCYSRCIGVHQTRRSADRAAGAVLGGAEGLLLFIVWAWSLTAFGDTLLALEKRTNSDTPRGVMQAIHQLRAVQLALENDPVIGATLTHNPLERVAPVAMTRDLVAAMSDPAAMERLQNDPRVRATFDNPVLRDRLRVFSEPGPLRDALRKRDYGAVVQSPAVQALLMDKEFRDELWKHFTEWSPAASAAKPADAAAATNLPASTNEMARETAKKQAIKLPTQSGWGHTATAKPSRPSTGRSENYVRSSR